MFVVLAIPIDSVLKARHQAGLFDCDLFCHTSMIEYNQAGMGVRSQEVAYGTNGWKFYHRVVGRRGAVI